MHDGAGTRENTNAKRAYRQDGVFMEYSRMRPATLSLCVVLMMQPVGQGLAQNTGPSYLSDTEMNQARAEILELERLGLPYLALQAAQKQPAAITNEKMRQLEADYAAELTRLAVITTRQESERFRIADRALAMYDRLIPQWLALGEPAVPQLTRIRIDRLEALRARVMMDALIADYEALRRDGIPVPDYALAHVAAAYLHQRQPEKAHDLYERALRSPSAAQLPPETHVDNQIGLFYALIESEQHDEASRVIDAAMDEQPIWIRKKGVPHRLPNPLRLDVEHTAALNHLYQGDTVGAQERLEEMVTLAPNNAGLRTSLAAVYREREWPRRARQELKMAETMAPRAITVEAEQAQTEMDLGNWENAEILLDDLQVRAPEHPLTRNAVRRWRSHEKAELIVSAQGGLISDTPIGGENDLNMETVLYSAPINYNWRPFAGVGYAHGKFDEGTTHFRWARAGVQWRGAGLTAELEGSSQNYGHGVKAGMRVSAIYDLNDHWQIGGAFAFRSTETPVRALHHDVTSNSITGSVRWRAHERREWSLTTTASRFTDGNKRISIYASGRERLYTSPHFKVDAELGIYASRNTKRDAPYFNPRADIEVLPAVKLTQILHRRYERSLEHSLTLGAGVYAQRGYGSGAVGAITYGIRYQHNEDFDIGASLAGVSRPYDGQRERELRFMLDMNIRF